MCAMLCINFNFAHLFFCQGLLFVALKFIEIIGKSRTWLSVVYKFNLYSKYFNKRGFQLINFSYV